MTDAANVRRSPWSRKLTSGEDDVLVLPFELYVFRSQLYTL
jgi:hypothetical protein